MKNPALPHLDLFSIKFLTRLFSVLREKNVCDECILEALQCILESSGLITIPQCADDCKCHRNVIDIYSS